MSSTPTNGEEADALPVGDIEGNGPPPTEMNGSSRVTLPRSFDVKYLGPASIMQVLWLVLFVVNILVFVLFVVKVGNVLLTKFAYTYDLPVNAPGTLLNQRFSFYYWFIIIPIMLEMAMLILGAVRIAIPWDNIYGSLHTILAGLAFVSEFSAAIAMFVLVGTVNTLGDPLNPANSEYFCAANSHPNDPALTPQGCPMPTNPYSITVTASDLKWDGVFTNNFGFTWAMVFLTLVELIVGVMMSYRFKTIFNNVSVWSDEDNTTINTVIFTGDNPESNTPVARASMVKEIEQQLSAEYVTKQQAKRQQTQIMTKVGAAVKGGTKLVKGILSANVNQPIQTGSRQRGKNSTNQ